MRLVMAVGIGLTAGAVGCGASGGGSSSWTCQTIAVPSGQAIDCQSSGSVAATALTTTCTAGSAGCPPVGTTLDGPPLDSGPGSGSSPGVGTPTNGTGGTDSGSGTADGGGGGGGGTLPPGSSLECTAPDILGCTTEDGPGDAGTSPATGGGGGGGPEADGGGAPTDGGGTCSCDEGEGGRPGTPDEGNGGVDAGPGNGHGPGGNGNGNGNGGGNGNGHGGGSPKSDAGAPTGASPGSDAGAPTGASPDAESPPGEGSPNGGPPVFTCTETSTGEDCVTTPTCLSGTHPSACGACIPNDITDDCLPPSAGGCWVTGGGFINDSDGTDSFGGNAKSMKDGTVQGEWENVDHDTGNKAHGEPSYLYCRHVDAPGPGQPGGKKGFTDNQVYYGGAARWFDASTNTWSDGYWFDVVAEDHGEGNAAPPDSYQITVRQMSGTNSSGTIVFQTGGNLAGGNIQLHPPNSGHPFLASTLPSWVTLQP